MAAKYERLANILRDMIAENNNENFKLPTEHALCNRYNVSRQTVRKALSILEEEHLIIRRQGSGCYATGLMANSNYNHVALLLSSEEEYIYPSLISDIRNRLHTYNYTLTVYVTDNMVSKEREILKMLLAQEQPVRGIIAEGCKTALPSPNADLYDRLHARNISILFLHGKYPNLPGYPSIEDDNFGGGYYLGKYLISLKHKKIAGIFKSDDNQGLQRYHGLLHALMEENISFHDDMICWYNTATLSQLQKKQDTGFLSEFIQKHLHDCTGIICYNDEIAYWLMKELKYAGFSVPEDISVVCFDNTYLSDLSATQITALSHGPHEIAYATADDLVRLMNGKHPSAKKATWRLVSKYSTSYAP